MLITRKVVEGVLERGEVVPFFQPLRELRSGRLLGFELLARWQHPELGSILPHSFIETIERSGLLAELTRQVLSKALRASADLPDPLRLAVNISPSQLKDPGLCCLIADTAAEMNFSVRRLSIEITETALVDDFESARKNLGSVKELGCRLLLDDFGTGYSNLRHLQKLGFNGLKIDRSFVSDVLHSRDSRKIVAAIVGLGQSLNLTTIAEGIECEEQASLMLYLGCDVGQGWHYGRPTPAAKIGEVVHAPQPKLSAKWSVAGNDQHLASLEASPTQRVAHLQAIYDGAPVGLCLLSRDLRYLNLNQHFAEINKTSASDMIGQTVESVFPRWFPLYEPYLKRALAGEALSGLEVTRPGLVPGDVDQTILISYSPARDEAGEVIGISMALVDITLRKQDETALRSSEERFRTLIDRNPQTPWIFDRDGNVLDVGVQWERLTGYTRETTLASGYLETIYAADRERVVSYVRDAIAHKTDMDIEWRVVLKSGETCWVRSRGSAVFDEAGEVYRYYGSTEDIDELVRLRRYKAQFERTRTVSLGVAQLQARLS
ncbi:EAL domain-containing protein [Acidipila sp. EB88]|uniref:sensor domain-containing phosphodiesterase n=1 Tax=Acidipila sp. EB88 TaxID=2305226 RepID=UPI000F5DF667|nr:EAL domain-containing protein [Acidipila sp. EB88]RRA49590.1 EAL domain-containing protein [Acidipila sp. EB88]